MMRKFKFKIKFIDVLNKCINDHKDGNKIEKFNADEYHSVDNIISTIILISNYDASLFTLPNDLMGYFKRSVNRFEGEDFDNRFTINGIKNYIMKETDNKKINDNFSDTYITIGNNTNKCNIKKFTVYL